MDSLIMKYEALKDHHLSTYQLHFYQRENRNQKCNCRDKIIIVNVKILNYNDIYYRDACFKGIKKNITYLMNLAGDWIWIKENNENKSKCKVIHISRASMRKIDIDNKFTSYNSQDKLLYSENCITNFKTQREIKIPYNDLNEIILCNNRNIFNYQCINITLKNLNNDEYDLSILININNVFYNKNCNINVLSSYNCFLSQVIALMLLHPRIHRYEREHPHGSNKHQIINSEILNAAVSDTIK